MAASMSHVMGVPGMEWYPDQGDLAGKDYEATKYTDACGIEKYPSMLSPISSIGCLRRKSAVGLAKCATAEVRATQHQQCFCN